MQALIDRLLAAERQLREVRFIAPCAAGRVRVRVEGLVHTLKIVRAHSQRPWGLFRALDDHSAARVGHASPEQIRAYLDAIPSVRARLAYRLEGTTWLAMAREGAVAVRAVDDGRPFAMVRSGWDGARLWFRDFDSGDDPRLAEQLLAHLEQPPERLSLKGLTPEAREAHRLAHVALFGATAERRLRRALDRTGGRLDGYVDRDRFWTVTWTDSQGGSHTSAIAKDDLTVMSAGICLSGEDHKFDLTSLVGVVEGMGYD